MSSFEGDVLRWSGGYFGWIDEENYLFTHDGRQIGQVQFNRQIYGKDGKYLGEFKSPAGDEEGPRLVTKTASLGKTQLGFLANRIHTLPPMVRPGDGVPLEFPEGYEDFPAAEDL